MRKIKKAIIPVAGMGTRFLPATKAQPKEMLTVVDKPVIQYLVEEAVASGIKEIILVTGQSKRAIEDHFDTNFELEVRLKEKGKKKELREVKSISNLAKFAYVRQKEPLGDGHAILQAKEFAKDEPIAVLFGDDLIDSKVPCLKQMMKVYEKYNSSVIALENVPKKEVSNYGIIKPEKKVSPRVTKIDDLVEKPDPSKAPSTLAIVGKYIITPEIFKCIENSTPSKGGELRLIDGFMELLKNQQIYGYEFKGTRYDCGSKIGYIKATVNYAIKRPEFNGELKNFLNSIKI